ncbi:steroid delta-isomerase, partial [Mycolicibacterium pulveris]
MATPEDNAKTVHRYLELVAQGKPDDIAELYADDATV